MSIREDLEAREHQILAPQAAKSGNSRGRLRPEPEDPIRPSFQRDRDRVIHCKAFRQAEAQDAGLLRPDGRSLPHAAHAHARGLADRTEHREGAPAQRGADGGHRARPRPGPHAVRPCGRARAAVAGARRVRALRAEPSHRRRPRERRAGAEPDVGSPRRDCPALEGQAWRSRRRRRRASREHDRGTDRARRRHHRLREPRYRRCDQGGAVAARRPAARSHGHPRPELLGADRDDGDRRRDADAGGRVDAKCG